MPQRIPRTLLSVALFLTVAMEIAAQAVQKPSFEVTSVKVNKVGGELTMGSRGGRFTTTNAPLILLVQLAYQTKSGPPSGPNIIGAPDWLMTERFDIQGKVAGDAQPIPLAQMWPMVQSLLEDRFKLKVHFEVREQAVYDLVVAKGGVKMKLSPDQSPIVLDPDAPPFNPYSACREVEDGHDSSATPCRGAIYTINAPSPGGTVTTLSGTAISMDRLRMLLRNSAGRTVIDKTNLSELYDIRLRFVQQPLTANPGDAVGDTTAPSVFTAVEQDLGLKLEASRSPVEVLVIDSVSKPSEN